MPERPSTSDAGDGVELARWRVPIDDDTSEPLHEHLEGAAAFVDVAVKAGGSICAFCGTGQSASPAVIAFYLMRYCGLSLAAALNTVCAARPDAQPNVGFWQRLVEAESWLHGASSMSLQEYKWQFLEGAAGEALGAAGREEILQRLQLGQAEIAELLRVHGSDQWSRVDPKRTRKS